MTRTSEIYLFAVALALSCCACAFQPQRGAPASVHYIKVGMLLDEVEASVRAAGGSETPMDIMAAPGSNIIVRSYGFAPHTVVSVGAQESAGEVRVISMMVCRDADKPKAYRHWEDITWFDLP